MHGGATLKGGRRERGAARWRCSARENPPLVHHGQHDRVLRSGQSVHGPGRPDRETAGFWFWAACTDCAGSSSRTARRTPVRRWPRPGRSLMSPRSPRQKWLPSLDVDGSPSRSSSLRSRTIPMRQRSGDSRPAVGGRPAAAGVAQDHRADRAPITRCLLFAEPRRAAEAALLATTRVGTPPAGHGTSPLP